MKRIDIKPNRLECLQHKSEGDENDIRSRKIG